MRLRRIVGNDAGRVAFFQAVTGARAVAEDAVAEDAVAEDRVAEDGVAEDAVDEDGVAEDGVAEDGMERALVGDVMALYGRVPAADVAARLGSMAVRAASRARTVSAPVALRHAAVAGDVVVAEQRLPYAHFFAVEEYDVAWRRFDGTMSETVTRAVFVSGDAVTVLPYDPVRDRVLLVEQFRVGPLARGDGQAWQLEAIAGRVDPAETPEAAARREAVEEAGLHLDRLIEVARFYPSPGAVSEFLYSYVALVDLPEGVAGVFGVADEAEDIRGHLISFDRLMALVASGEVQNAPLILTALWLQRERDMLRAGQVLPGGFTPPDPRGVFGSE